MKRQVLKKTLIALLTLLFLAAVTLALVFVNVPAQADEELVLSGNTADYSFINDFSNNSKNLWVYSRSKNEWTTNDDRAYGSTEDKASVLTLKVTKDGDIALQWIVGSSSSIAFAVRHYTDVPEDGSLDTANVDWVLNKGAVDTYTSGKVCFGDDSNYQGKIEIEAYRNYQNLTIPDCKAGDYVTLAFWTSGSSHYSYNMKIKGLKYPDTQFTFTARIAEGQTELGTIKTEKEGETSQDGVLTITRGYDESVTFTAVPQAGYVAYWQDSAGKKLSGKNDYTITKIKESNDNTELTVRFVKMSAGEVTNFVSTQENDEDYFKLSDEDKYSLDFNLYDATETARLNFSFYIPDGGAYLTFNYIYSTAWGTSSSRPFYFYIDGIAQNGSQNRSQFSHEPYFDPINIFRENKDDVPVTSTYVQWFPTGGYYDAYLNLNVSNSYIEEVKDEKNILSVENFKICSSEELTFKEMTFSFNEEFSTMQMTYDGAEAVEIKSDVPVKVPVGLPDVDIRITQSVTTKTSKLDPDKTVQLYFDNFVGNFSDTNGKVWSYKDQSRNPIRTQTSTHCCVTVFNDEKISTSVSHNNTQYEYNIPEEGLKVDIVYIEQAPIVISATKTSDGAGEVIEVKNGDTINMPYGKDNSLFVRVNSYNKFNPEDFTITIDGTPFSGELQQYEDAIGFALTDLKNRSITLAYSLTEDEEYIYNKTTLTFAVKETQEGVTFEDTIKSDDLNVVAGGTGRSVMEWEFDPYRSEEGNYAYWGFLPSTTKFNTQQDLLINFSMGDGVEAQSGSISFEFQLKSYAFTGGLGNSYSGLLYYQLNKAFTLSSYGQVTGTEDGCQILQGNYSGDATFLAGVKEIGGDVQTDSKVVLQENGWYRVSLPIEKGQTIYLAYFMGSGSYSGAQDDTWFSIRNIRLNTGIANINLQKCAESTGSVQATVGEETKQDSFSVAIGTAITLQANLGDNEKFYGWSVDNNALSNQETFTYFVEGDCTITAYMAAEHTYQARIGGVYYKDLQTAVTAATEGQTVTIIENDITISNDLTIPKDRTLLLPYNAAGGFTETGTSKTAANQISWYNKTYGAAYLTLTVTGNAKITVNGTLRVGGVVNDTSVSNGYQGHTSGAYSEIILKDTSSIVVEDGGVMDVYGRVWGGEDATAMGTVEIKHGGKLYEPFLILDYAGGSNALACFTDQTTPFKRYAMINIECPLTINYGGQLFGHASLWVPSFNMLASLDQPFISYDMGGELGGDGNGNDTFVILNKGASVTITYDSKKTVQNPTTNTCTEGIGQTTMTFEGGAAFSYMLFSAMGLNVPTLPVYFSIPYNFNILMNAGEKSGTDVDENYNQYETRTNFMIMPGATVTVGKGATLTLNANTWVVDGYAALKGQAGKLYPLADSLAPNYALNGNLIVDGTLKIGLKTLTPEFSIFGGSSEIEVGKQVPATFVGIVQTNGSGRIEIPAATVLSATVWSGLSGQDYFAYDSTARIYDSKTGEIVDLTAGHDYVGKAADPFTLKSIKYTTTPGGEKNTELTLNQQLKGSWMIVHEHAYDWTLSAEEQQKTDKIQEIERECTELGCTEHATRTLLKVGDKTIHLGAVVYDGKPVTTEEIIELFKAYFKTETKNVDGLEVTVEFGGAAPTNHGTNYSVTIKIGESDEYYFYATGDKADSKEAAFQYNVDPAKIDGLELNDSRAYNGNALTAEEVIKAVKSGEMTLTTEDYSVEIENNAADKGEYTVKVTGKNDFTGEKSATYTITAAEITITVKGGETTYAGKKTAPAMTGTYEITAGKTFGADSLSVTVKVKDVPTEWSAKEYALTAEYTLSGKAENYEITVADADAMLKVNKAEVTITVQPMSDEYSVTAEYDTTWKLDENVSEKFFGEYTEEQLLGMLDITCDLSGENNTVGQHPITAVLKSGYSWSGEVGELENFKITVNGNTYTLTPAGYGSLEFGGEKSVTYDGQGHALTLTFDDESVTITIYYKLKTAGDDQYKTDKPVNAGTYDVKAVLKSANYNEGKDFEFPGGELTITPAPIDSVELAAESKPYDKSGVDTETVVKAVKAGKLEGLKKGTDYTVSVDKATANVGDYKVTVQGTGNYAGSVEKTYKITAAEVTVTVYNQEKDYDMNAPQVTQSGENVIKVEGVCAGEELGITLGLGENANQVNKGEYPIIPGITNQSVAANYNVTFQNGEGETFTLEDGQKTNYPVYSIKAIAATVTIDNVVKTYGDAKVETYTVKTSGFLSDGYTAQIEFTCELADRPAANADGYTISGVVTNPNDNYTITVVPGKYIVNQKAITVAIADQTAVYDYLNHYEFNADGWTTDDALAYDDDRSDLGVTLTKPNLGNAGEYEIVADWSNKNYAVTFEGSKDRTKGKYTISKLDLSSAEGATFWLTSEAQDWSADGNGYRVKYMGETITMTSWVDYTEGETSKRLTVTTNPEEITAEGEVTVTMTINETNYAGSKTVTVVVTDAEGYTEGLRDAMAQLEALAEGIDPNALKESDFETLKEMIEIISGLGEKEKEVAATAIAEYQQLIDKWNGYAEADDLIEAAETIADAPISGLFEAAAVVTALVALAYIAMKGGLL